MSLGGVAGVGGCCPGCCWCGLITDVAGRCFWRVSHRLRGVHAWCRPRCLLVGCWEDAGRCGPMVLQKKRAKIKQTAHCIQWRGLVFAFARISLSWLVAALWLWLWLCLWFLLLIWLSLRGLPSLERYLSIFH